MVRLVGVFIAVCCLVFGNQTTAATSSGRIAVIPAVAYGGNHGTAKGTTVTSTLMLPDAINDDGTITLVVHAAPDNTSLVTISAADLPEQLRFMAGESEILYLSPMEEQRNTAHRSGNNNLNVEIPYVKGKKPDTPHKFRIVDAAGRVFQNATVSLTLFTRNYPSPIISLEVDADGYFTLPAPFGQLVNGPQTLREQGHNLGYLQIKEPTHGQIFEAQLASPYENFPEVFQIPFSNDADTPGLTTYTVKIVNADGTPASQTSVNFSFHRSGGQPNVVSTVTLRHASPAEDGFLRLATSPEMQIASPRTNTISGWIYEDRDVLFQSAGEILLQPGENPDIILSKRLTLDATLVTGDGKLFKFTPKYFTQQLTLAITRMTSDTERPNHPSLINLRQWQNGTVFSLPGLPVPGSYIIAAFGREFGPVEISETSPTELIQFKEAALDGKFVGQVLDENGKPLAGALVVASKKKMKLEDFTSVGPLIEKLKGMSVEDGKMALYELTSGTYGFSITDESGRYAIPREIQTISPLSASINLESINLVAAAPGRFPTYTNWFRSNWLPQSLDVEVKPVRLPAFAYAAGAVKVPTEVLDEGNPGAGIPLPAQDAFYTVELSGSEYWFSSQPRAQTFWRYDGGSENIPIEKPFKVKVPAGTTFTLEFRIDFLSGIV